MINYIKKYRKEKKINKNRNILNNYDRQGYYRERVDISKMIWNIFSKDFKIGDEITWLGHDNVFGLLYGEKIIADKDAVNKKEKLSFWKEIDILNFE